MQVYCLHIAKYPSNEIPKFHFSSYHLPYGFLATNDADGSLGLPNPALFCAVTLTVYSDPSRKFLKGKVHSVTSLWTSVHLVLNESLSSTV